jgi:hypothetical protein
MTKTKKFMPKSKKNMHKIHNISHNISKKKKRTRTRTNKNKNIKRSKNPDYINIDNTGSTEVVYTEGKLSPKKTVFEWNGNYDGKNAKIHMDLDIDGKKTKTDLKLSNQDLMNILSSNNVVNRPIDQRLQSLDEDLGSMYPSAPVIIHPGEMPMNEMPMNEMPMPLEPEIIIIQNSNSKRKRSNNR